MNYIGLKENSIIVTKTPFPGYNLINMIGILGQNKFLVSIRYIPRLIYSLIMGGILSPFRIKEKMLFDKKINKVEIKHDPIFIIGHWRCGTTYLHNILSLDKNLGYFTTFQAYLPGVFLGSEKLFKPLVASSLPGKRPMDQYALGALTPYSYYHGWCFPKNMDFYNKYVVMENVDKEDIYAWKKAYLYLIKKVTFFENGKRLVLKNQDNTAKIKLLLEMFPDAKFILLIRDPYDLYYSMMKFMRIVIPLYCLQNPPPLRVVEDSMFTLLEKMFKKYFQEKNLIPMGNLVEMKYEKFISEPLKQLENIYKTLNLDGFNENKETFEQYINAQKKIKLDTYRLTEENKEKINKRWHIIFKEFNYKKIQ